MFKKNNIVVLFLILMFINISLIADTKYAGFRSSRVMPGLFPEPLYWSNVCQILANKFVDTEPAGVWIVSTYWGNGECHLHFPNPGNSKSYENISFGSNDLNEPYLDLFDSTGIKVWLQVESGDANVDTLISLVMNRYKHHECVFGFGVDNEWYFNSAANDYCGRKVTDEEAERWENNVKTYNSDYTLTLKHWDTINMPPNYRGEIIFVDDSQDFDSLDEMTAEFKYWGKFYKNNPVIYQFGYNSDVDDDNDTDEDWWGPYADPAKIIGNRLFTEIDNCLGIYWVDFTIKDVFPVDDVLTKIDNKNEIKIIELNLSQNYPNPFNSNTNIEFEINKPGFVRLEIFDICGSYIDRLVNETLNDGNYKFNFSLKGYSTGIYYYKLICGNQSITKKMIYLK